MTPETVGHPSHHTDGSKGVLFPTSPQGQGLLELQQSQQNPNTQNGTCHLEAAARCAEKPDPF